MRTMSYWDRVKAMAWALKGDGCSKVPDFNSRPCCDEHDIHYRTGATIEGVRLTRREADRRFYECMKHTDGPILAGLYWLGVRMFGEQAWDHDKPFYEPPDKG